MLITVDSVDNSLYDYLMQVKKRLFLRKENIAKKLYFFAQCAILRTKDTKRRFLL